MIKQQQSAPKRRVEELIKKAQQGDVQAFAQIYLLFSEPVYRFCLFKTSSKEDAQDITSETFKRIWRYLNKYKKGNFQAFLFTIARNFIVDYYKNRKNKIQTNLENVSWLADDKANIEKKYIKQEELERLALAVNKLAESYREVIILRFIEELSIKETAAILGKSSAAIRVLQHRAINKLKTLLKPKQK
jgi:RNA polymerase sigma-70 factor (ECF subfamily)